MLGVRGGARVRGCSPAASTRCYPSVSSVRVQVLERDGAGAGPGLAREGAAPCHASVSHAGSQPGASSSVPSSSSITTNTRRSSASNGSSSIGDAPLITTRLASAGTVDELRALVQLHTDHLNAVHVAAGIVRLAKLPQGRDSDLSLSAASRQQPGASSSGSGSGMPRGVRGRRRDQQQIEAQQGSIGHDDVVGELLHELSDRFLQFSTAGHYQGARQYANVAWALGKLPCPAPPALVHELLRQAAGPEGRKRWGGAAAQEVANYAYGLARLGQRDAAVWSSVCAAALAQLPHMQPQEVSTIAWALATVEHADKQLVQAIAAQGTLFAMQIAHGSNSSCSQPVKPSELVTLLWACVKLGYHSRQLMDATASYLLHILHTGRHQQGQRQQEGREQLQGQGHQGRQQGGQQQQCRVRLNSQDLANALWSFAVARHPHSELFAAVAASLLQQPQQQTHSLHVPLRSFKQQELVSLLWAFAKAHHQPPAALLQAAYSQLADRVSELTSQGISNSLWAAARLGHAPADLAPQLLQAAAARLPAFSPQELSNTLWAAVRLSIRSPTTLQPELLQPLVAMVLARLDAMHPVALVQVAWAAAQLSEDIEAEEQGVLAPGAAGLLQQQVPASAGSSSSSSSGGPVSSTTAITALSRGLCAAVLPRLQAGEFGPQELVVLAFSQGRQRHAADPVLLQAIGQAALAPAVLQAFTPGGLSILIWAFACSRQPQRRLAMAASAAACPLSERFTAVEAANLLWALAVMKQRNKALLDRMAQAVLKQRMRHLLPTVHHPAGSPSSGTAAAVLAWAFAKHRYHQSQLYDQLAAAAVPHLHTIAPYNLARLLWAFAAHDHKHAELFDAAAARITALLTQHRRSSSTQPVAVTPGGGPPSTQHQPACCPMHPLDLSMIAWAYAKLGHHSQPLFDAVLACAMAEPHAHTLRTWSRLAWAFSTLCLPGEEAFFARLHELQAQALTRQPRRDLWQQEELEELHEQQWQERSLPLRPHAGEVLGKRRASSGGSSSSSTRSSRSGPGQWEEPSAAVASGEESESWLSRRPVSTRRQVAGSGGSSHHSPSGLSHAGEHGGQLVRPVRGRQISRPLQLQRPQRRGEQQQEQQHVSSSPFPPPHQDQQQAQAMHTAVRAQHAADGAQQLQLLGPPARAALRTLSVRPAGSPSSSSTSSSSSGSANGSEGPVLSESVPVARSVGCAPPGGIMGGIMGSSSNYDWLALVE